MAFYGLTFAPGDRILTARAEYASNVIAFLQVAARTGAVVEVVDNDESGQLSVDDLRRRLADGSGPVKLVAITHVPTQGGLVNPAEEIGAANPGGRSPLPPRRLPVGRTAPGRRRADRLRHPLRHRPQVPARTTRHRLPLRPTQACLDQIEPPFLDLHAATWTAPDRYEIRPDARRFENWETNYAAKIGLGVAVDYALSWGLEAIEARVTTLADRLRTRLADAGRRARARPGPATLRHRHLHHRRRPLPGSPAALAPHGVNVSVSLVDYARLDLPARGLPDLVRASVHYYNTDEELDRLVGALPRPFVRTRVRQGL